MPYKDKDKQKEAQRKHYLANKDKYLEQRQHNREKRKVWFCKYKSKLICYKCGLDDPRCLDFHHRNPAEKSFSISQAVHFGMNEEAIVNEIAKCDVLCSNCHIKSHFAGDKYQGKCAKWLREYKKSCCCNDCGNADHVVLTFHHVDPATKVFAISWVKHSSIPLPVLIDEINKCEVLCSNCHRIRHDGNRWTSIAIEENRTSIDQLCESTFLPL